MRGGLSKDIRGKRTETADVIDGNAITLRGTYCPIQDISSALADIRRREETNGEAGDTSSVIDRGVCLLKGQVSDKAVFMAAFSVNGGTVSNGYKVLTN